MCVQSWPTPIIHLGTLWITQKTLRHFLEWAEIAKCDYIALTKTWVEKKFFVKNSGKKYSVFSKFQASKLKILKVEKNFVFDVETSKNFQNLSKSSKEVFNKLWEQLCLSFLKHDKFYVSRKKFCFSSKTVVKNTVFC